MATVQGLRKAFDRKKSTEDQDGQYSEPRVSNKIEIEELLRLKKQDVDTQYMDATLQMIKLRGSDYGLHLANYVKH